MPNIVNIFRYWKNFSEPIDILNLTMYNNIIKKFINQQEFTPKNAPSEMRPPWGLTGILKGGWPSFLGVLFVPELIAYVIRNYTRNKRDQKIDNQQEYHLLPGEYL